MYTFGVDMWLKFVVMFTNNPRPEQDHDSYHHEDVANSNKESGNCHDRHAGADGKGQRTGCDRRQDKSQAVYKERSNIGLQSCQVSG